MHCFAICYFVYCVFIVHTISVFCFCCGGVGSMVSGDL